MKTGIIFFLTCLPALADLAAGLEAMKNHDYAAALKEFLPLATEGDASAQFNLGVLYDLGHGVPQNYKEAARWYRLSAEQGTASAEFNLGQYYYDGHGVPQDYKESVKWHRLAAEQGHPLAEFNLGYMFARGKAFHRITKRP